MPLRLGLPSNYWLRLSTVERIMPLFEGDRRRFIRHNLLHSTRTWMILRQDLIAGGSASALVDPDVYRDNPPLGTEYKAVTIGLRINCVWESWYPHQNVDGTAMRDLIGVTKL